MTVTAIQIGLDPDVITPTPDDIGQHYPDPEGATR